MYVCNALYCSRWTPDEHRLFLEGIMLYGKDWKKMQPLIKTRTLVQIRTHAQKVFKKIGLKKMNGMKRKDPNDRDGVSVDNDSERAGGVGKGMPSMNDNDNDMDDGDVSRESCSKHVLSASFSNYSYFLIHF